MLECLILAFHVLVVRYVTKNTGALLAFAFFTAASSLVGLMWVDESPVWLIKTGNVKEAIKVMRRINEVNGVK